MFKAFIWSFTISLPIFIIFFILRKRFILNHPKVMAKINDVIGSIFIWGLFSVIFGLWGFLFIGIIFTGAFISKIFS